MASKPAQTDKMIVGDISCEACQKALLFQDERAKLFEHAKQIRPSQKMYGHALLLVEVPIKDKPQHSLVRTLCEEVYPSQVRLELGVAADWSVGTLDLAAILEGDKETSDQIEAEAAFAALLKRRK